MRFLSRARVLPDGAADFNRFVAGRRVVVVGPARTLLGQGRGAEIDGYDVVVRLNQACGAPEPAAPADVGARTDICYANQVVLRQELLADAARRERFLYGCAHAGVRFVVCTNNSLSFEPTGPPRAWCPAIDRRVLPDVAARLRLGGEGARLRVVYSASWFLHRWLDGHWARTGFVALFDLLMADPALLHVAGMTFYHGGGHVLAPAHAELSPRGNRDGSSSIATSGRGHDSTLELEAMRWLRRCFARQVTVDDELERLLR